MNDNDPFADAARDVLADHCTPAAVRAIEAHDADAARRLWQQLEATGLADALVSEDAGGSGLKLGQAFGMLEQCGAHALPLPLGETMAARALLGAGGYPRDGIALARAQPQADGGWHAQVRGGRVASHVLAQCGQAWRLLPVADASQSAHALPLDAAMAWSAAQVQAARPVETPDGLDVWTLQACVVSAQMAGAMGSVLARTLQYANERQQFGRPIGKFQAIQHQLAVMSEHVYASRMAAQLGCSTEGAQPDRLRVAMAKARCSEGALAVSELAHSIHGAIGFTEEYDLQLYTRRLHCWRQTAGSEAYWQDIAGAALLAHDGLTLDLIRAITDTPA